MSKYKCISCGESAFYTDFYKRKDDKEPDAVYAYCTACNKEAWGGMRFHPAMNELFNKLFMPNWEFNQEDTKAFERKVVLRPS